MIENKKAFHNYDIKETLEVGILLSGAEVKSVRANRVQLDDSYVKNIGGKLSLVNADISKYQFANDKDYDALKTRTLLAHQKEIDMLSSKSKQWGMTLVPLKMYDKRGKIKLLVGLGRGRKKFEKKNVGKERDLDRELHREQRKFMVK